MGARELQDTDECKKKGKERRRRDAQIGEDGRGAW